MQNTSGEPLLFFENVIKGSALNALRDTYYKECLENLSNIINIDRERCIVYYLDEDANEKEHSFNQHIHHLLRKEFKNSKKYIERDIIQLGDDNSKIWQYLNIQISKIKLLLSEGKDTILKIPDLLLVLNGIVKYINNIHLPEGKDEFTIDESSYHELLEEKPLIYYKTEEEIVNMVFGYMKGLNEKQQRIMTNDQYNLMIGYINDFVNTETIPQVATKIEHIKITKDLLRFSFWVLHKELITTNAINDDYIHFLIKVFDDLKGWSFESLKKIFGAKTRVFKFPFISETIKKHLQK